MADKKTKIRACPFCGYGRPKVMENSFYVGCPSCGTMGPDFCTKEKEAIERWNRRPLMGCKARYKVAFKIAQRICDAIGQKDLEKRTALAVSIADDIKAAAEPV